MSELAKDLGKFLRDSEALKVENDQLHHQVRILTGQLKVAHEWKQRLSEKVSMLEGQRPWGPDGWDEKILFDKQMTVKFSKRFRAGDDQARRVSLIPKIGRTTVVIGRYDELLLRRAIEEMSGRKRTSPEQQEAPSTPRKESKRRKAR